MRRVAVGIVGLALVVTAAPSPEPAEAAEFRKCARTQPAWKIFVKRVRCPRGRRLA